MLSHGFFGQIPWLVAHKTSAHITFSYRHQGHFYHAYPFLF